MVFTCCSNVATCNLGEVKHDSAGQWSPLLIVYGEVLGFSRALVILQHCRRSQLFCSRCFCVQ